jgi:hypothetical protein
MNYYIEVFGIGLTYSKQYATLSEATTAVRNLLTDLRYQMGIVRHLAGAESERIIVGTIQPYQPVVPSWGSFV